MSAPLIDDSLVEMVKAGIVNAHGYEIMSDFEAARIARAALAVAVPAIAGKCADIAEDEWRQLLANKARMEEQPTVFQGAIRDREVQALTARELSIAIRSLTKDSQS